MSASADGASPRAGNGTAGVLAVLGGAAVFLLARAAPEVPGAARLRSPEILLAVFDTAWLLFLALPRHVSWPSTLTRLAAPAPFHVAIAAACGAGGGFHAAWTMTACAFAAVGTLGARAAPAVHGLGVALLSVALPLAAYAAGEFGRLEFADVRAFLLASPLVAPTLLARTSTTVSAADAVPALVAAALLLAAGLVASRMRREPSA